MRCAALLLLAMLCGLALADRPATPLVLTGVTGTCTNQQNQASGYTGTMTITSCTHARRPNAAITQQTQTDTYRTQARTEIQNSNRVKVLDDTRTHEHTHPR